MKVVEEINVDSEILVLSLTRIPFLRRHGHRVFGAKKVMHYQGIIMHYNT
jgi:hypothetical protein